MTARTAIVTGGGSGLGRATALALAGAGYGVVIAGRREGSLEMTKRLSAGCVGSVVTVPCDVTSAEDRQQLVDAAVDGFERVDVLVNNAGVGIKGPLLDYSASQWRAVFETNVEGPFFLSQLIAPVMRGQGGGRIINVSSVYGSLGRDDRLYGERPELDAARGPVCDVAYHASKGALTNLTRQLAVVLAPWGVTVNAISPGMFATEMSETAIAGETRGRLERATPVGRLGLPEEVGHAVLYLASEGAAFTTGVNLCVDGGWTAW